MKKHKLSSFLRWTTRNSLRTMLLATTLSLLAACTADDRIAGDSLLPQGKYPLTFTATQADATATASPQTRVSESTDGMSSKWDGDEQISVRIGDATETGVYTLHADGTIKTADKPLYWQNTASQTVTAWYSNISGQSTTTNNTVSLADQSSGLAYVMKATAADVAYNTPVSLKFQHQLAKVRVKLEKGTYEGDLSDATVKIKGYTSCNVDKGTITNPTSQGYISTRKNNDYYEANLLPKADVPASDFIKIIKQNAETAITLNANVTLAAGSVHTFTITVNIREIDLSSINEKEYTVEGNVLLKGNSVSKDLRLIIKEGAKVTLDNVVLSPQTDGTAITCEGNNTITLNGTNSVSDSRRLKSGILVTSGTLVIQGNGELTVTSDGSCIGAANTANITINSGKIMATCTGVGPGIGSAFASTCGTITINGGTLEAHGRNYSAGIGGCNTTGHVGTGSCGDIIITGGNIKAYGGEQSPGIGNGDGASCGDITISGASTVVYAKKGERGQQPPAASIGKNSYNGKCGKVTIGTECDVTQE